MDATEQLSGFRVVPVVVIDDAELAVPLAQTLLDAGLAVIEITLRTEQAMTAIRHVTEDVPAMLTGAGSIRNVDQLDNVFNAGAKFAVSPGSTVALTDAAIANNYPFVPGATTPSEMLTLVERGYRLQKFFPAEASGGIRLLKSVATPIPEAKFMPTGGITAELAKDYLALPNVAGVGGSWIVPAKLLQARDFDSIARLASAAVAL